MDSTVLVWAAMRDLQLHHVGKWTRINIPLTELRVPLVIVTHVEHEGARMDLHAEQIVRLTEVTNTVICVLTVAAYLAPLMIHVHYVSQVQGLSPLQIIYAVLNIVQLVFLQIMQITQSALHARTVTGRKLLTRIEPIALTTARLALQMLSLPVQHPQRLT